ncbi:MAG: hypothetical protein QM487_02520 [Candidatus Marithrix sp.]
MKSSSNNILLLAKIILPSIICALLFIILEFDIGYHVLFFSLVIILFNFGKIKYSHTLSFILSAGLSYMVFFVSIALYFGIGYIIMQIIELDKLDDISIFGYKSKQLLLLIPVAIISPILMFLSFQILFKIEKSNYFKIIKWITIIMLSIIGIIRQNFENEYSSIYWQFAMVFALQLILYKKELFELIKR